MYSNLYQWKKIRNRILVDHESIRSVAKREGMSRATIRKILTHERPPGYGQKKSSEVRPEPIEARKTPNSADIELARWQQWLYELERGDTLDEQFANMLSGRTLNERKLVLAAMAWQRGFSKRAIAEHLVLSRNTVMKRLAACDANGTQGLLARKPRLLKTEDPSLKSAIFGLLHEPPSLSGYNRTTWRIVDLRETLAKNGHDVGTETIRRIIKAAGFKWKSAKVVLTSTDPEYRQKLEYVQTVLANLGDDERFFSIDEFGPFAVKAKPGRVLAAPGESPSVPQWQKSKGWLITTAALELSRNQVTHFFSRAKNTAEMIKMAEKLLADYRNARTLYLSWDAASWHMSKELRAFVDRNNSRGEGAPRIELVPLPASAQFLNVIESVFSGMARAIIHSSDYPSVKAACDAIDRYFEERNRHYADNPKRAGRKIWGKERTEVRFDPANNCKDPLFR